MKSREKLSVSVEMVSTEDGQKPWAKIRVLYPADRSIIPSFEDVFQIVHAIVHCERKKYAGRVRKPSDMVRRFLNRMVDGADKLCEVHPEWPAPDKLHDAVWCRLADEFQIPLRDDRSERPKPQPVAAASNQCRPGCTCELCKEWPVMESA